MSIESISSFVLPNRIHGRSIFNKVIPTVNSLESTFRSLDQKGWSIADLKQWEKPIVKAFCLEEIINNLRLADPDQRISLIRNQILKYHANDLGNYPITIYLLAYFIQQSNSKDLQRFIEFAKQHGISQKENSITAIWYVAKKDGRYLGIFDAKLNIIDLEFLKSWVQNTPAPIVKKVPSTITKEGSLKAKKIVPWAEYAYSNHLECFLDSINEERIFMGVNSFQWCKYVMDGKDEFTIPKYFDKKFYRDEIWEYCNVPTNGDLESLLIILSWGGMDRKHAKRLLEKEEHVKDIVRKLRTSKFETRQEAFGYIQDKRKQGLLPGMGIGYFTKLICFLQPSLHGYIMDQWVAKSVNLLLGKPLVDIASKTWVSDLNTPKIYEEFCSYIDELAVKIEKSGFETEEYLFSVGGHKKGMWRGYLVQNYG